MSTVNGKTTKIFDDRVEYQPLFQDQTQHIEVGADGVTPVIPVDKVNNVLVENEMLRETLYLEQNSIDNNIYATIKYSKSMSMKVFKQSVTNLSIKLGRFISDEDIYELLYDMVLPIDYTYDINSNETILKLAWKGGYLPILSVYLHFFEIVVSELKKINVINNAILMSVSQNLRSIKKQAINHSNKKK